MPTLGDVKKLTRNLLGDDKAQYANDAFLVPKINSAYQLIVAKILQYSTPVVTKLVVIPEVPAGTTTLSPYQFQQKQAMLPGQAAPLAGLMTPLGMQWKQAGLPESRYVDCLEKGQLPNISPGNYVPGFGIYWEWRQNLIYITPVSFLIDLQVRGEFAPQPLLQDSDEMGIHPLSLNFVAYTTATIAGGTKMSLQQIQVWKDFAEKAEETILSAYVRKDQGLPNRVGKMTGGRRRGFR